MSEALFFIGVGYLARWIHERWQRNPPVPVRPAEPIEHWNGER